MEQLEMDFDSSSGRNAPMGPQRYRFNGNALVVDYADRQLLFGLWDRLHGFWRLHGTGGSEEVAPPHWWRPLNEQGVWSLSEDAPNSRVDFVPRPGKSNLRYEANAAFVAYFDAIPRRIRRLVGGLESYQWLALDLIWQVPEFAAFWMMKSMRIASSISLPAASSPTNCLPSATSPAKERCHVPTGDNSPYQS